MPSPQDVDLRVDLAGILLPNPVMTASGCAAAGRELDAFFDVADLGAVVTKSIMLDPRAGRPTPRMAETPSGMLNSIGLQGPGIDSFLGQELPWLARRVGSSPGVSAVEVNISCPNVANRGMVFACDPYQAAKVIAVVRRDVPRGVPVFAKLSPDVTDLVGVAEAVVAAGASGLSMINTTLGLAIDPGTLRPVLGGVTGGLSGPAIRPLALRCVWQVHQAMPDVPIIGIGGIKTGFDALAFLVAGASAVQVGTVIFHDPGAPMRIVAELRDELSRRAFTSAAQVVGLAHTPATDSLAATDLEGLRTP